MKDRTGELRAVSAGRSRACGPCGQPSAPIGDRPKPSRPPFLSRGRPALSGGGGEGVGRGLGAGDEPPAIAGIWG